MSEYHHIRLQLSKVRYFNADVSSLADTIVKQQEVGAIKMFEIYENSDIHKCLISIYLMIKAGNEDMVEGNEEPFGFISALTTLVFQFSG